MSQKNETTLLVLSFAITAMLLGGIILWLIQHSTTNQNPQTASKTVTVAQSSDFTMIKQVKNVPSGLISYGGSSSWAPLRKEIDPIIQNTFPQFQLRYTDPESEAPSSTTGINMLLKNQLEFAQASRPISKKEYEEAQKRGFQLKEIAIALDGLAVVVHPDLKIPGITSDQFEAIFDGKIINWQQLGGPNLKIQPYGKKGRDTGNHFKLTETTTEALRLVANDPGGIYWASAPLLVPQCGVKPLPVGRDANKFIPPYKEPLTTQSECRLKSREVNTDAIRSGEYPLTRRLVIVVKQNGNFEQQIGEAYANMLLTNEGQERIARAGFVRLR
jgi:phosphate transport system substrate-binding protein